MNSTKALERFPGQTIDGTFYRAMPIWRSGKAYHYLYLVAVIGISEEGFTKRLRAVEIEAVSPQRAEEKAAAGEGRIV